MRDTRERYDTVANLYLPIMIGVVALVLVLAVVFALLYRRRAKEGPADKGPSRISEAPFIEGVYVVILILVVALLLWRTYSVEAGEDDPKARPAATIVVTAARWHWRFDYGLGVSQRGTDQVQPTLVVPQNTPIRFRIHSIDVIHAFWIPGRRDKKDANPAMWSYMQTTFPDVGFVRNGGECSEFCGLRHAQMRFNIDVRTPSAYRAWLNARIAARRAALGVVVTR